jgi:Piwi domain
LETKGSFSFYSEKQKGFAPIYWGKIMETFPEGREAKYKNYYTDFKVAREGAITTEVVFKDAVTFSIHYFRHLIFNYFKNVAGAIVFPNYVDDIEVWFKDEKNKHSVYQLYNKYSVKVQYNQVILNSYELVIAYNGTSKVLHKAMVDIKDYDADKYNMVVCNGTLIRYRGMADEDRAKLNIEELYPVLSNDMKKDFITAAEIEKEKAAKKKPKANPYLSHFNNINYFYNSFINVADFKKHFDISKDGFYQVPNANVFQTHTNSNLLEFKDEKTNISPSYGLWKHKPLLSFTAQSVKIFFIYNEADGPLIHTTIYDYIKNGWHKAISTTDTTIKHLDDMQKYLNQTISIDKEKRITFTNNDTIYEEVSEKLKNFKDTSSRFIAIYISPISKADTDHPQHKAYHKIKELLLYKGISSQVLYKEHLSRIDYYYFLPNIYIALLAKIGGIPWRLARKTHKEIIIGVGAFKPKGAKQRFLGSAFCFSNEGVFENFNCFPDDDPIMLAGSISNAVESFIEKNKEAKRVIIHFYKEISDHYELKPILQMLDNLGERDLPVIVVTVNKTESKEQLGFDLGSDGKMPMSGRYVKIGYNEYLLFNNTRYTEDAKINAKEYHFPIKLKIKATKKEIVEDVAVIRDLIDQVYQFSRMYWKSVSQQNLPVTTKYPEMVAEIFPHFDIQNLSDFGKENLWFL